MPEEDDIYVKDRSLSTKVPRIRKRSNAQSRASPDVPRIAIRPRKPKGEIVERKPSEPAKQRNPKGGIGEKKAGAQVKRVIMEIDNDEINPPEEKSLSRSVYEGIKGRLRQGHHATGEHLTSVMQYGDKRTVITKEPIYDEQGRVVHVREEIKTSQTPRHYYNLGRSQRVPKSVLFGTGLYRRRAAMTPREKVISDRISPSGSYYSEYDASSTYRFGMFRKPMLGKAPNPNWAFGGSFNFAKGFASPSKSRKPWHGAFNVNPDWHKQGMKFNPNWNGGFKLKFRGWK